MMRLKLMQNLLIISSYIYEEITDKMTEHDIGCDFWKYLKTKILDDITKKIKVSDYIREYIMKIDCDTFNKKYNCNLKNIKKSPKQLQFIINNVTLMIKDTVSDSIISWV